MTSVYVRTRSGRDRRGTADSARCQNKPAEGILLDCRQYPSDRDTASGTSAFVSSHRQSPSRLQQACQWSHRFPRHPAVDPPAFDLINPSRLRKTGVSRMTRETPVEFKLASIRQANRTTTSQSASCDGSPTAPGWDSAMRSPCRVLDPTLTTPQESKRPQRKPSCEFRTRRGYFTESNPTGTHGESDCRSYRYW